MCTAKTREAEPPSRVPVRLPARLEAGRTGGGVGEPGPEGVHVGVREAVTIEIALPDADVDAFRSWLADATAGTAGFEAGGEAYGDV